MADVTLVLRVRDFGQKRLAEAGLQAASWRTPLKQLALLLKAEAMRSFATATDPDGRAWAPLKRAYRGRGSKPLRRTGVLMGSQAAVTREDGRTLYQGTNVDYAGYHQFGTKFIPARPFAGVGPRAAAKMGAVVAEFAAASTALMFSR